MKKGFKKILFIILMFYLLLASVALPAAEACADGLEIMNDEFNAEKK